MLFNNLAQIGQALEYTGVGDSQGIVAIELALGSYEVEAQRDGYQLLSQKLEVSGDVTNRLALVPLRGVLSVETTPEADVVAVGTDGVQLTLGKADKRGILRYERLVEGNYTIKLSHRDYESGEQKAEIYKDSPAQIRKLLQGKPGGAYVSASPQAEVWVDGKHCGNTGERIAGLQPGVRHFEVKLKGYRSERFELTIPPNKDAPRKVLGDLVRASGAVRVEVSGSAELKEYLAKVEKWVKIGNAPRKKIDGMPFVEEGLSCEDTEVVFEAAGFALARKSVKIEDGQTAVVPFDLEPDKVRLTITANTRDAEIFDKTGRRLGKAGEVLDIQPFTPLSLTVKAVRYSDRVIQVAALEPGKERIERVVLEEMKGPIEGQAWVSPVSGMEFVWIAALKIWVGKYEVTNGEYRKKELGHDSKGYEGHSLNGDHQPVVYVNFDDAKKYAAWLTERDKGLLNGLRYRVISEKEWEVCARCGDNREYPWGNAMPPKWGNYADSTAKRSFANWTVISNYTDGYVVTCSVEKSGANEWGLYGIGGNVWEACASDNSGVAFGAWRGASWCNYNPVILRCASRGVIDGSNRDYCGGFRLVVSR